MFTHQDHQHLDTNHPQQSKLLYDLSSLVLNILRSPPSIHYSDVPSVPPLRRPAPAGSITPAGFASLMMGVSLALMLCGSVTFFIGFMLLPWVIGLVLVFYFVGLVSSLSLLGRTVLCYALPPPSSPPRKDIPGLWDRNCLIGGNNGRLVLVEVNLAMQMDKQYIPPLEVHIKMEKD